METAMVAALQHVREVRSSTRRWRGLWRSSQAQRGVEGETVAAVVLVGGGGSARVREGERNRGGGELGREGGAVGEARGVVRASLGRPGRKQEVARGGEAGGGRGSVGERHASPLLVLLAEEEEDKGGGGGLGWASGRSWAGYR